MTARPVPDTSSATLTEVVSEATADGAAVYTDEARAYKPLASLGNALAAAARSASEHLRGDVHTNGIEWLWSRFKRGYTGTYHKMSEAHLHCYINEFTARHNIRPLDAVKQMGRVVEGMASKRLTYRELTTESSADGEPF